ncbi:MAG: hypothetical protein QM765_29410 [Myxococcales bacterium]
MECEGKRLVLLLALLTGCFTPTTEGPSRDAGAADAGPAGFATYGEFATAYAAAKCATAKACCHDAPFDVARCEQAYAPFHADLVDTSVAQGQAVFMKDRASLCVEAIRAAATTCPGVRNLFVAEEPSQERHCSRTLVGAAQKGAPCDQERVFCAEGLACTSIDDAPAVCVPAGHRAGEPCGDFCDAAYLFCDPQVGACAPYRTLGEECDASAACLGLRCDQDAATQTWRCVAGLPAGAACSSDAECQSLVCETTATCRAQKGTGAPCSDLKDCESFICRADGTCASTNAYCNLY